MLWQSKSYLVAQDSFDESASLIAGRFGTSVLYRTRTMLNVMRMRTRLARHEDAITFVNALKPNKMKMGSLYEQSCDTDPRAASRIQAALREIQELRRTIFYISNGELPPQ